MKYDKGLAISGLDEFEEKKVITASMQERKFDGDQIVTNGGRVLGVTAKGKDLKEARANAYTATEWVKFLINICVMILEKQLTKHKQQKIWKL